MEFNAKLETALGVELAIAQNLREEIYAALDELNKLTGPPESVVGKDKTNQEVTGNGGSVRMQMNSETEDGNINRTAADMAQMSVDGKNFVSFAEHIDDQGHQRDMVTVDCFPHGRTAEPVHVPASKLSYLNHAELLRKYSGI